MARDAASPALEHDLMAVGALVDFPEVDVTAAVAARIAAHPQPARAPRRRGPELRPVVRPVWRPLVAVAAAVILLAGALLVFAPGVRSAVAGFLGLRGARIQVVPPSATASLVPTSVGGPLLLGERVTLAEAQARMPFRIQLPSDPRLGPPDEVFLTTRGSEPQVFLVWRARPGFPKATFTGAGLLLSEFRARVDERLLEKKLLGLGTTLQSVEVNGEPGFWIAGKPHALLFYDANGNVIEDTVRLAGNVLLWQQGDLTLRLEAALPLDPVLDVARGVR
jgi:hypothetical protein